MKLLLKLVRPLEKSERPVMSAPVPLLTSMARSLVAAVDAKDNCTRGHSERVQIVSSLLGETLGVDEATANDLYWASLLHDVGKIGISDRILLKPGRLSESEGEIMKGHVNHGIDIVKRAVEEPIRQIAENAGLSPIIIGLTVVSLGTSA